MLSKEETRSMDKRSLNKEILNIGVPSFLETLFTTFAAMIDSKMVAVMGVPAISAVSVTNQPRLFIFSVFFALQTVTTSLVAKYYGKNDPEEANKVFDHALKLVVLLFIKYMPEDFIVQEVLVTEHSAQYSGQEYLLLCLEKKVFQHLMPLRRSKTGSGSVTVPPPA